MDIFNQTEARKGKVTAYHDYPYIVYGRVSTDKDEQVSSLENQVEICHSWLEKNNFEWNEKSVLLDDGISGTTIVARKAMRLILDKARKKEIKMVLFKSISRLARDLKDALEIKELLLSASVRVVTIEEGYDSFTEGKNDMKFEMFSMFAAQYPKSVSVSTSAAFDAKVRRGEWRGGKTSYGYYIKDKKLAIREDEARVVRLIFKLYNEQDMGFKNITHYLNDQLSDGQIIGPRIKKTWQLTTVQSIIKNPVYCGVIITKRYDIVKINGRKKQIKNPPEKWKIYYNQHPKIISVDEWKKANPRDLNSNKIKITPWNEFRGLAKCSECGSNMVILQTFKKHKDGSRHGWKYLKCSAYRRSGTYGCVNHAPILYKDFRALIIELLKKKGKSVKINLKNDFNEKKARRVSLVKDRIKNTDFKVKRLISLYMDELINKDEFQSERQKIEANKRKDEEELFLLNDYKQQATQIKDTLKAFQMLESTDQDLHSVFKALIDEIIMHPNGEIDIHYKFSNK
ncbi:recombinase family protein [Sporolactobacillus terrae]|uniref:recombinase family protein n=1 Tax=Sporolactobacillus terrae TaxID=269673 RepID=UPI0006886BF8|nr:recombinase family protein [Sporolactobacillus terrae]